MISVVQTSSRMRAIFLATFVLVAVLPASLLSVWIISTTTGREFEDTAQKQIQLSKVFAQSLDQYAQNLRSIFIYCVELYGTEPLPEAKRRIAEIGLQYFAVLDTGTGERSLFQLGDSVGGPTRENWAEIEKAVTDKPQFLPLMLDDLGEPKLFIAVRGPGQKIFASAIETSSIVRKQQSISFGMHGHAVVLDQIGQAIAHPLAEWGASAKDLSAIEPVQHALAKKQGFTVFYAPARDEDAIAGYSVSSEAGWIVLMVRPTIEIHDHAWEYVTQSLLIIGLGLLAAMALAAGMAQLIVRPVENAAAAARQLEDGNFSARIDTEKFAPREIRDLSTTFNRLAARMEEWRKAANESLSAVRQSDQAKTDFLATLSHEIRTPLNAIIGFSDLLRERLDSKGASAVQEQEYASDINAAGLHLWELIDEILDLSAMEAGGLQTENSNVCVATIIKEASSMLGAAAAAGQITIGVEIPDTLPSVSADPLRLRQVLLNLIGNSIKFTPAGGAIRVWAARKPGAIRIAVEDNGIGMSEDEQRIALTPFGRAGNRKAGRPGGTGLGLPLAKRLVETMNGQFELQSDPETGTSVFLELPSAAAA